jgi:hypothetical protein
LATKVNQSTTKSKLVPLTVSAGARLGSAPVSGAATFELQACRFSTAISHPQKLPRPRTAAAPESREAPNAGAIKSG